MSKNQIIKVEWHEIVMFSHEWHDFICITDIMKSVDANQKIEKRLSNRWTVDFLWTWEAMHNPDFNYPAFWELRMDAWSPSFTLSVTKRKETTNAIWIFSKLWKFGWTYAHKDIAFEFASRLSPQFKLYIIKEFQRLKDEEQKNQVLWRDIKRLITKANYRIHTDAIKDNLAIWIKNIKEQKLVYSSEADLLNMALFGMTSGERVKGNPKKSQNGNIRDDATIEQLTVLSNLEVLNAEMIKKQDFTRKKIGSLISKSKRTTTNTSKFTKYKKNQRERICTTEKIAKIKQYFKYPKKGYLEKRLN